MNNFKYISEPAFIDFLCKNCEARCKITQCDLLLNKKRCEHYIIKDGYTSRVSTFYYPFNDDFNAVFKCGICDKIIVTKEIVNTVFELYFLSGFKATIAYLDSLIRSSLE